MVNLNPAANFLQNPRKIVTVFKTVARPLLENDFAILSCASPNIE